MFNLLAAFTIKEGRLWDLQIQFGLVHPKTKVEIKLEIVGDQPLYAGKPRLNIVAELASKNTVATFATTTESEKPDPKFADIVSYGKGELVIDQSKMLFHLGYETGVDGDDLRPRINCSARLDFLGDGSAYVPSSGQWVDFWQDFPTVTFAPTTSSSDF